MAFTAHPYAKKTVQNVLPTRPFPAARNCKQGNFLGQEIAKRAKMQFLAPRNNKKGNFLTKKKKDNLLNHINENKQLLLEAQEYT